MVTVFVVFAMACAISLDFSPLAVAATSPSYPRSVLSLSECFSCRGTSSVQAGSLQKLRTRRRCLRKVRAHLCQGPPDHVSSTAVPVPTCEEVHLLAANQDPSDRAGVLYRLASEVAPAVSEGEGSGYSKASYYTSLGLFVLSFPGLYSIIKRSAKSKIVKKTYEIPGPKVPGSKPLNQVAGEVTSYLTRNNYSITDRGDVVTFKGNITPSRSQASFLVFCTALSLASLALVLTITVPALGEGWYWITALSPLAGVYYWTKASRTEEIKVKMVLADDESTVDVVLQGDDGEIDRLRKEMNLMEKGMVYVKGILEG